MGGGQRNSLVARVLGCLNSVIKKPNDELEVLRVERGVVSEATLNKCCQDSYVKNYTLHTSPSKLKCAFTLAEVLITLGVIGVVAALTMPTLITNYQKKVTVETLKQTYSILSQAVKMSEIDNGQIENWELPGDELSLENWIKMYITPYLKYTKLESDSLYLNNGTLLTFRRDGNSQICVDVYLKGSTENENFSRNHFLFLIGYETNDTVAKRKIYGKSREMDIRPYDYLGLVTVTDNTKLREYITLSDMDYACNKNGRKILCGALIMYDGWQIKDDYPW